jgi:hypothetical protein
MYSPLQRRAQSYGLIAVILGIHKLILLEVIYTSLIRVRYYRALKRLALESDFLQTYLTEIGGH